MQLGWPPQADRPSTHFFEKNELNSYTTTPTRTRIVKTPSRHRPVLMEITMSGSRSMKGQTQ